MSAAKLSRPKEVRFAHPLPHHRLAKTQIICAILPRRVRVVLRSISDLCLRVFSVMDLLVHSLKSSAQKSELHPQSFRARRQANESEAEPPKKRVLCTPRMRRNQKVFFHPLNRRAEAAPQKTNLNKVCHSVNLCPISPISPISPRNAPAAASAALNKIRFAGRL